MTGTDQRKPGEKSGKRKQKKAKKAERAEQRQALAQAASEPVEAASAPIETAIMAILKNEPPRLFKVQQTINDITFDHVYDLIENPMPCC